MTSAAAVPRAAAATRPEPAVPGGPDVRVYSDSTLREVANEFARRGATVAAVVDRAAPGRAVGEITLDQLLHARREDLREDEHRERPLPLVLIPPSRPRTGSTSAGER